MSWTVSRALVGAALLIVFGHAAAAEFTFGVGPQQSTIALAKRWVPIFEYLSRKSGVDVRFATARDIPTFQRDMRAGKYDFAYINPYHYTLFRKSAGYDAFAQEASAALTGILVVRRNAPIHSLRDLNGKQLAFPAPGALTATVLPMNRLEQQNVHVTPHYVKSHDSVYLSVAKGLYAAGGGESRTFHLMDPAVRDQLRILWTAPPLPPFLFAANPRVPADVVRRLQGAMLHMADDAEGRELLRAVNFKGIRAAKDSDYDAVRKLKIRVPQ